MKPTIALLGCGWLGLPLAQELIRQEYRVNGSATSPEKLSLLQDYRINPFLINCTEHQIEGDLQGFLAQTDILIIAIPPKLRGQHPENFVAKIRTLISGIAKTAVTKVLFISSTAVYPDTNSEVTELILPQPDTENGRQLLEAEMLLTNQPGFKTTVVRFGGLIGNDRHPIKFLAGKENIENPEAPVNFIHQTDCIGILSALIKKNSWGETFNAVAPFHPTRESYYTEKAIASGLAIPKFNRDKPSRGKIINSDKLIQLLPYQFLVPEL